MNAIRTRAPLALRAGLGRQQQEEWNGMREDTHKTFDITRNNFGVLFATVIVFPATVWIWSRHEEIDHDLHKTAGHNNRVNKYV